MTAAPTTTGGSAAATTPPKTAVPGVDDDPGVIRAKVELELAKVAQEKARLGLSDQSERTKLAKEMVPDFSTATFEKEAITSSDKPSSLSESVLQKAVEYAVDDVADMALTAVRRLPQPTPPAAGRTFLITSDTSYLADGAARRDVLMRLERVERAIADVFPVVVADDDDETQEFSDLAQVRHLIGAIGVAAPLISAGLSALPGAISMASRLFAHQYTTSTYTSSGTGCVDSRLAGQIAARTRNAAGTRVLLARRLPANDTDLQRDVLNLAHDLDDRVSDALRSARVDAAERSHHVDLLSARRATLEARATDIHTAWKDKVGKSAASAGLTEDLAVAKALEAAVGEAETDGEKERLAAVLKAVQARIAAVLKAIAEGSGELGAEDLQTMLESLDIEAQHVAGHETQAKDALSRADERVAEIAAVHTAGLDLLESLGTVDADGDRLLDKACRGAALDDPATLVLFARLHHGGADGIDDTKAGPDHRTTVFGATVEWALTGPLGVVHDSGARTVLGYMRTVLSHPDKSMSGLIDYTPLPRVEL